jgi:hypothetical protein
MLRRPTVIELTGQHFAATTAAGAVAAAIGQHHALAQRSVEQAFVGRGLKSMSARFNADLKRHRISPRRKPAQSVQLRISRRIR